MSALVAEDWSTRAACTSADPELFFPDNDTPAERIVQAKQICAGCPVRSTCLQDAFQRNELDAICGGLTAAERQQMLNPGSTVVVLRHRRPGKPSPRQLAVQHGAYLLTCLVQHRMSLRAVASQLGATESSVYRAFLLLVPPRRGHGRPSRPTAIEKLLGTSKERLKTLQRRGLSHTEIGVVLETSQSIVSASLAVLRQREEAMERLATQGRGDALERLQDEEVRLRVEAGAGLTVDDVIQIAGRSIQRMHGEGMPLRQVARELDLNREVVRRAHQQMTSKQRGVAALTQDKMGEAA